VFDVFGHIKIGIGFGWMLFAITIGVVGAVFNPVGQPAVLADSNTITITAVVAPVKIMIVDSQGTIQKIISNSPLPTAPIATTNPNCPLVITPPLLRQYADIAAHHNLNRVGVVYFAPVSPSSSHQTATLITIVANIISHTYSSQLTTTALLP